MLCFRADESVNHLFAVSVARSQMECGESIFLAGNSIIAAKWSLPAFWVELERKKAESKKTSYLDGNNLGNVALKKLDNF